VGGTNPSLLEALGCGNAIIAHDYPFNREVAGEAAAPKQAADELPDEDRRRIGQAGREKMIREFDERIVIAKYLQAIKDIVLPA